MSTPFTKVDDVPGPKCNYSLPKPLNHPNNDDIIIISTDYEEGGIYQLDLNTNILQHLHAYDLDKLQPDSHGHFIDINNTKMKPLYVFGGDKCVFGMFDLNKQEMEYSAMDKDAVNTLRECSFYNYPSCTYVPSPFNEVHVYSAHKYSKFKITQGQISFMNTKVTLFDDFHYPKLLYVESQKQLMMLGANGNDCIGIYKLSDTKPQWEIMALKMPRIVRHLHYDILLAFENVIFVFYFSVSHDIWCLDLLSNTWFETKYQIPDDTNSVSPDENVFVMKDGSDQAHLLYLVGLKHIKVNLHDLIPKELYGSHRAFYKSLIMGYMRQQEKDNSVPCLPLALKTLILIFYPL